MKLTKDECRILARGIDDYMDNLINHECSREESKERYAAFKRFQDKLWESSKDKRRNGRKSMNDYNDCLRRFVKSH